GTETALFVEDKAAAINQLAGLAAADDRARARRVERAVQVDLVPVDRGGEAVDPVRGHHDTGRNRVGLFRLQVGIAACDVEAGVRRAAIRAARASDEGRVADLAQGARSIEVP